MSVVLYGSSDLNSEALTLINWIYDLHTCFPESLVFCAPVSLVN
jgi:hypothetical protein